MNEHRKSSAISAVEGATHSGFKTPTDINEEEKKPIAVAQIAHALKIKFAYLSGAQSDNSPIVSMPQFNNFDTAITDDMLKEVLEYFADISLIKNTNRRFTIVLDRRNSNWNSVKTLLRKLQVIMGRYIAIIYLLRPQKIFSMFSFVPAFSKSDFTFEVVSLNYIEELHQSLNTVKLTEEFGGILTFDVNTWLDQRIFIEDFEKKSRVIMAKINSFVNHISDRNSLSSDIAGTLTETMQFLSKSFGNQRTYCRKIVGQICEISDEAKEFKDTFNISSRKSLKNKSGSYGDVLSKVEDVLARLSDTRNDFKIKWNKYEDRVNRQLRLYNFEIELSEITKVIVKLTGDLAKEKSLGDSVNHTELLHQITTHLQERYEDVTQRLTAIGDNISRFTSDSDGKDTSRINVFWKELVSRSVDLKMDLESRLKLLAEVKLLHVDVDKVNKWCSENSLKLIIQFSVSYTAIERKNVLKELETMSKSATNLEAKRLKKLQNFPVENLNEELKLKIQDAVSLFTKLKTIAQQRIITISKSNVEISEPNNQKTQPKRTMSEGGSPNSEGQKAPSPSSRRAKSNSMPIPSAPDKKKKESSPTVERKDIAARLKDHLVSLKEDVDTETNEDVLRKRNQIMEELLVTEQNYVKDIKSIIQVYMKLFNTESTTSSTLRGKKEVLFGNIEKIYEFHNSTFAKALDDYKRCPALVGQCFLRCKSSFDIYYPYCRNRPDSEAFWEICETECGEFFETCKNKAGHVLPLNSYLLKPIQRITKYQLLLKDMLKNSQNSKYGSIVIKEALDLMLALLQRLNDSMHLMLIKGYQQGDITKIGAILIQDSFQILETMKKGSMPVNRKKYKARQLFLFDTMLLFTKKLVDEKQKKNITYQFKDSIKLLDLGMTETVKMDQLAFEVWSPGREKVYIVQASAIDLKERWVKQIRQLLISQFQSAKALKDKNNQGMSESQSSNTMSILPMFPEAHDEAEEMWSEGEFSDVDGEQS